jgi:hypothetical protein
MPWITPITDRIQEDVDFAKENQSSTSDLKGAWNISDINRIIDNTIYLRNLLFENGYNITIIEQSHIVESDIPYITSFIKVLKDNIKSLVDGFYSRGNPVIDYSQFPTFTMANNLEINLEITNSLLNSMIAELKYCGEPKCNDDIIL